MKNLIKPDEYETSSINNLYKKYNLKNEIGFVKYLPNQNFELCNSRAENCINYEFSDNEFKNLFRGVSNIKDLDFFFIGESINKNIKYKSDSIFLGNLKKHSEFFDLYYLGNRKFILEKEKNYLYHYLW